MQKYMKISSNVLEINVPYLFFHRHTQRDRPTGIFWKQKYNIQDFPKRVNPQKLTLEFFTKFVLSSFYEGDGFALWFLHNNQQINV